MTDVLERLCCVAADLTEEDFVATGVLCRVQKECVSFRSIDIRMLAGMVASGSLRRLTSSRNLEMA